MRIGLISDTHGLLRPEATTALQGVDLILHSGDIGPFTIISDLRKIAPVHMVRGNMDYQPWERLPLSEVVEAGEVVIYMIHDIGQLELDPAASGFDAVIYGHSHQPAVSQTRGVWYINPGSAGGRRFNLPITLGFMEVKKRQISVEILDLETGQPYTLPEPPE